MFSKPIKISEVIPILNIYQSQCSNDEWSKCDIYAKNLVHSFMWKQENGIQRAFIFLNMHSQACALTARWISFILHTELNCISPGRRPDETLYIVNFHLILRFLIFFYSLSFSTFLLYLLLRFSRSIISLKSRMRLIVII